MSDFLSSIALCSNALPPLAIRLGITITQKQATIAMSGFSVMLLIWLLAHIFWWTLSTSGFLTGVHCLLRDASMHKDEEDRVEMQGDLSLDEEASFLNSGPDPAGSMA